MIALHGEVDAFFLFISFRSWCVDLDGTIDQMDTLNGTDHSSIYSDLFMGSEMSQRKKNSFENKIFDSNTSWANCRPNEKEFHFFPFGKMVILKFKQNHFNQQFRSTFWATKSKCALNTMAFNAFSIYILCDFLWIACFKWIFTWFT